MSPVLRTLGLLLTVAWGNMSGAATPLVSMRSDQSSLPESILRETDVAIDRSRQMLLHRRSDDGLWTLRNGARTVFPVLALDDPEASTSEKIVRESLARSRQEIAQKISASWKANDVAEAAYNVLASEMNLSGTADPRLVSRLQRINLHELNPADAALLLLALEARRLPTREGWTSLVNVFSQSKNQTPESVALSAYGRLKTRQPVEGRPAKDVLAYVRWIANKIDLGYGRDPAGVDPITPRSAFFISLLAAQLPRQVFHEDTTLLPYDWRTHLASRLISQQRNDPVSGLNYWDTAATPSPDSDTALRDTTYAIMTLVILAE